MATPSDIQIEAERLIAGSKNWADAHNAIFDPIDGLLAQHFRNRDARAEFAASPQFKSIQRALDAITRKSGLVEGATATKSGRFVVRLPKSLHGALDAEARAEGVSLNQLVLTKLAIQLSKLGEAPMAGIIRAFAEVRDGFSADRVIADPLLDERYLLRCRQLGVEGTDFDLNWALMSARKNGHLSHLPRTKKYTPANPDLYEHASEMAVRYVQQVNSSHPDPLPSVDRIICDPSLAKQLDQAAAQIAPGFSSLDYRWVALALRKARRLTTISADVEIPEFHDLGRISEQVLARIPVEGGLYLVRADSHNLFIGETDNLRDRFRSHLGVAGSDFLPKWLHECDPATVRVGVAETPGVKASIRKAMELTAIRELRPALNYVDSVAKAA